MHPIRRICVFCGSRNGNRVEYPLAAMQIGTLLAKNGIDVVYGGGSTGLMGAVADAALEAGGKVIGVIPRALATKELAHAGLTEQHVVETMHERKWKMAELADAFLALPGGFGTFEEFCEVLTWAQLGMHVKPCALLNTAGYFNPLLSLLNHAVEEGFVEASHRKLIVTSTAPDDMLRKIMDWQEPTITRWWVKP